MTSARHRAVTASSATHGSPAGAPAAGDGRLLRGAGPRGMWWVAWRQHRITVLIAIVILLLIAGALLGFRAILAAHLQAVGCSMTDQTTCFGNGPDPVLNSLESWWRILHIVLVAAPVVLGVFVGAPIFPREFDQRTQVFALTQSVGRLRWWAIKITVAGVPLLAGLVGLGYLARWVDTSSWFTDRGPLDDGTFQVQSIMPASYGLLALAIAVTAGILVRSVVGSLVTGLLAAAAVVVIVAFPLRSHLLPVTRSVTPIQVVVPSSTPVPVEATGPHDPDNWYRGSGLLDANGNPISFNGIDALCESSMPPWPGENPDAQAVQAYNDAFNKAMDQCQRRNGITREYLDYVPASMAWPLRGIEAGICVLLAGLALAFGAFRLRARAGSRS